MSQKYGYLANMTKTKINCDVCQGSEWSWTDRHGEAYCTKCGTPHQIVGSEKLGCSIIPDFVIVIREYFQITGKRCGMGTFIIDHDYEMELEERKIFMDWVKINHPEFIKKKEDSNV